MLADFRWRVYTKAQHPYNHSAADIAFTNPALPGVNTFNDFASWLVAVLYPQDKAAVANIAALPAVGNTLGDYRIVNDTGSGVAGGFRWEQREGDASPKWYQIYAMNWGADSVMSAFLNQTQNVYVNKYGYDDVDASGVAVAGTLAGQTVYGGRTAGNNLTFYPNAGDGAGAVTGYVQFAGQVRPTTNNSLDLGTSANKFRTGYYGTSVLAGTMTLSGGVIADSSGAVSFGALNLSTTGTASFGATTGTSFIVGTTTYAARSITDTTPTATFSFNAMAVSTSGVGTFGSVSATGAASAFKTGTTVGNLTLANGSITDGGGAISFASNTLASGAHTIGNSILSSGQLTTGAGDLTLNAFSGTVTVAAANAGFQAVTATSYTRGNTVLTDGALTSGATTTFTLTSPTIIFAASTLIKPSADATSPLGDATHRFKDLFMSGSFGDGTNTCTIGTLLSLRAINTGVSTGYGIFYNGTQWVAADPDTEVFHDSISHLTGVGTDGDAGHSQFVVAAGRAAAQTIKGGTAASANLTLDSTAHATKGRVLFNSDLGANADGTQNIGGASNRFNNLYMAGQAIGLRVENYTTAGRPAAGNAGRLYWDTTTNDVFADTGSVWQRVSRDSYYNQDTTGWTGSVASVTYTISGWADDVRKGIWQFQDNSNNHQIVQGALISFPSSTQVTVAFDNNLAAGTYTLVGIG